MNIACVDHFSINVLDAPESLRFYGAVLGLPRLPSVRMADHELHYFQIGNFIRLELIDYDHKTGPQPNTGAAQGRYQHLALRVTGLRQWEMHLRAAGVRVTAAPAWVPALQTLCMLIRDCNGVEIELIER